MLLIEMWLTASDYIGLETLYNEMRVIGVVLAVTFFACSPVLAETLDGNVSNSSTGDDAPSTLTGAVTPSVLRLAAQQELDDGNLSMALKRITAALSQDPESIRNHLVYARVLTALFERDRLDTATYKKCLAEWQRVRSETHDSWDSDEALNQLMQLRVDKVVAQAHKHRKKSVNAVLVGAGTSAKVHGEPSPSNLSRQQ